MKTWVVWSQDVWGHSSEDCTEHDCPCMVDGEHDDDSCQCSFTVNDRCCVGSVEIPDDASDEAILKILDEDNFIHADMCEIDDIGSEFDLYVVAKNNQRPLLQLELDQP